MNLRTDCFQEKAFEETEDIAASGMLRADMSSNRRRMKGEACIEAESMATPGILGEEEKTAVVESLSRNV